MFIRDIIFPITDGLIVSGLRAALVAQGFGDGLTVGRKLPAVKTRRMVTVHNDAGPNEGRVSRRRYRFNWYSDDSVDCELMVYAGHSGLRLLPDGVVLSAADQFADPFEVEDEVPFVVGGKNLIQMSSACRFAVKGSKPS